MADDEHEWTDWTAHDGACCPCPGEYVQMRCANGHHEEGIVGAHMAKPPPPFHCNIWFWSSLCWYHMPFRIMEYRIRKNRQAKRLLEEIERIMTSPVPLPGMPVDEPEGVDG